MLRKIVMAVCFGYLLIAFTFIALAMSNASVLAGQNAVAINELDARVVGVMALVGLVVTAVVALRMMLDSRRMADQRVQRSPDRREVEASHKAGPSDAA